MERLNDILQKNAQRRQQPDQRAPQQDDAAQPEARPYQSRQLQPPLTRRLPQPEQSARLSQQAQANLPPAASRPPLQPGTRSLPRNGRGNMGAGYSDQGMPRQPRGYDVGARREELPARPHYQQPPLYAQEPRRRTTDDYYETYPPRPPADVQEDWEDDTVEMRYGDWEGEAVEEEIYSRPRADHLPPAQGTRELPSISAREREAQPHMPRTVRGAYSQAQAQPPIPPAPQAPTREVGSYHRVTQPLNPRAIGDLRQEYSQHAPRSTREQPARQRAGDEQPQQRSQSLPAPLAAKSVCPKCKGAGYLRLDVPFGHPNFGRPIACECKEAERKEKRRQFLRGMSKLEAFQQKSFKTFDTRIPGVEEAFQVAYDYALNPYGWLLMVGPNGCGKTHLAAAIANQNLNDGALVLFTVVPDLLFDLRATWSPSATETHEQLFFRMREAELLVLDDLGAHKNSPWTTEKLFQLLNYRYNLGLPTVITANIEGLQGIDERIRSRLNDASLVSRVEFNRARDYRPRSPRRG